MVSTGRDLRSTKACAIMCWEMNVQKRAAVVEATAMAIWVSPLWFSPVLLSPVEIAAVVIVPVKAIHVSLRTSQVGVKRAS